MRIVTIATVINLLGCERIRIHVELRRISRFARASHSTFIVRILPSIGWPAPVSIGPTKLEFDLRKLG